MSSIEKQKINISDPSGARTRHHHALNLNALADRYESSLRQYMPAAPCRDYYLWATSSDNPQRKAYLQVTGIAQLAKLTTAVLDGLIDDDWEQLTDYSAIMNTYLLYETASDNLAFGLRSAQPQDATFRLRRNLLYTFNLAVLKRLNGDCRPAAKLLESMQSAARRISSFDQSLSRDKHVELTQEYLCLKPDVCLNDLEYSVWPLLVANVEVCIDLAKSIDICQVGPFMREGLVARYQAVNSLLKANDMTLPQLANAGMRSSLIMPLLTYYIAVLVEIIRPQPRIASLIADGTLTIVICDAALLFRLLNDLGTAVCTLTPKRQTTLLHQLASWHRRHSESAHTIFDVFIGIADESAILTRLRKDVLFGEFNVGLYGLDDAKSMPEAFDTFGRNIDYFVQLYTYHYARLEENLTIIDARLDTDIVSELILRFIRFHQHMYSTSYRIMDGEYAV